ncbi:unnamed protein product [Vitrella brassicaformis CCMP3155]|uniref:Uncharacterized protein n=1 Tax=Vitrella brassicaformis (strain CCMP3155) TaxID=1169540 RepID=A0A0G4E9M7_VITBC|nr:unnamed protein product [Vitrella brassicaformis CCMP3155]|eukprot:CEL92341.1 unnamed protein product [Vitrella brassicaformis CCMP3155]
MVEYGRPNGVHYFKCPASCGCCYDRSTTRRFLLDTYGHDVCKRTGIPFGKAAATATVETRDAAVQTEDRAGHMGGGEQPSGGSDGGGYHWSRPAALLTPATAAELRTQYPDLVPDQDSRPAAARPTTRHHQRRPSVRPTPFSESHGGMGSPAYRPGASTVNHRPRS